MIIGYSLLCKDNSSFFLEDKSTINSTICSACDCLLNSLDYFNPFFELESKIFDLSSTYDNRYIASLRFKEFCLRNGYKNILFKEFEKEINFFQFLPTEIVEFDAYRRKTEFIRYCEVCNSYREIIGAIPVFLKNVSKELSDNFYRTDLLFGANNAKQPLMIIGVETYKKLKREKMKGLIFDPIYS